MSNLLIPQLVQRRNGKWHWRFMRSGRVLNDDYASPSKAIRALTALVAAIERGQVGTLEVVKKGKAK